ERLRTSPGIRLLPRSRRARARAYARHCAADRCPRLRPDRHPGPSLPAGPLRRRRARGLHPWPDRSRPPVPGCRQPAAAAPGGPCQNGRHARPVERRPLRARARGRR
ncbi:MAG: luciferase-like protein, partial [uncultured Thermomicrobiales bacterium]